MNNKITTFLWFDNNAQEAVEFYTSIFKNSKINGKSMYNEPASEVSSMKEGSVMTIPFELDGHPFIALNGGPVFKFSPATSFFITCSDQYEVDYFWEKLGQNGKPGQCGWIEDKFGISWQVVPEVLGRLMGDPDKEKAKRVTEAMLSMKKLEIDKLMEAYNI